jgi:prepilin-type N-terminal cleavage/methylation domain-containing protein
MIKNNGFTLVELAIVMVIMGLIIAGAISGKELLKAASLKATMTEISSYKIAVDNFKQQYEGLPGDLKNASSFWAGAGNGNNDGRIGTGATSDDTEAYYLWNHLSRAQMIAGTYSGTGTEAVIGTNVPKSKNITGAGYSLLYLAAPFSYVDAAGVNFPANYFVLGANHATFNYLANAAINAEDAFYIDNKFDDGSPDSGSVMSGLGVSPTGTCTTGSAPDILYNFSNSSIACIMLFALQKTDN